MPNGVKYSTTTPTGAFSKSNVAIGVSGSLGPTANTGFYSMPTPSGGKYIINKVAASGVPLFFAPQNDTELIQFAKNEGATESNTSSVSNVLAWISTQPNLSITNIEYPSSFPSIVADQLLCYYDANINTSYPDSGTVWYDISGNGNDISMNSPNPTFSTVNGVKCFKTDSSRGQGFGGNLPKGGKYPSENATLESWVYANPTNLTSADRGCIILLTQPNGLYQSWNLDNNNLSNYWYNHNPEGYWEPGSALTRQVWVNLTSVWDYNSSTLKQYVNGSLVATYTTQGTGTTSNYLLIGYEGCCGDRNFPGYISVIRIYSKAFSPSEVLQNYNAQKSRFGL
jgi:hypothetical protein